MDLNGKPTPEMDQLGAQQHEMDADRPRETPRTAPPPGFTAGRGRRSAANELDRRSPDGSPVQRGTQRDASSFLLAREANELAAGRYRSFAGRTVDILVDVSEFRQWRMAYGHIAEHAQNGTMFSFNVSSARSCGGDDVTAEDRATSLDVVVIGGSQAGLAIRVSPCSCGCG